MREALKPQSLVYNGIVSLKNEHVRHCKCTFCIKANNFLSPTFETNYNSMVCKSFVV